MSKADEYLASLLPQVLRPGEQVLHTAYMRRQPGLLMQLLLVGGLLLFLMTKAYFAVLTNQRLVLIRTKMSFWSGGPKLLNLGVEEYATSQIRNVTVSGIANNRSMTFELSDGSKQKLRISPWFKQIGGTRAFFEQVPGLVSSGHLAQLAGGQYAHQQLAQPQHHQPQLAQPQHHQPQLAQPQHQQPQHHQPQQPWGPASGGFPSGARVMVLWSDGQRYPATVVQEQGGHCLCAVAGGAQHWFPPTHVFPG